eukprot:CAMPEP_0182581848 /NCGR_PEP_ID=MMETSP1324-20130603/51103_1 /TAXON_ID=236786 /ORGANISM="Florenciella sp., Strain RCC1587" /LENGTH=239 /DNA_ID=CAMNT_0024798259 /DNA_START=13 /DNA_END=732 /DNA_ORIENTATION=-
MSEQPAWLESGGDNPFTDESVTTTAEAPAPPANTQPYEAPSWAQTAGEDAAKQAATQAAQDPAVQRAVIGAAGGIAQDQANQAMEAQKKKFSEMPKPWFIMRILNWLILVPLAYVAWAKAFESGGDEPMNTYVVAFYIFTFTILICCFEVMSGISFIAENLAKLFGFMYTVTGRLVFLVMTGLLVISFENDGAYIVTGCVMGVALYNVAVMLYYPEWTKQTYTEHAAHFNDDNIVNNHV